MKKYFCLVVIVLIACLFVFCGGCKTVDSGTLIVAQAEAVAATESVTSAMSAIDSAVTAVATGPNAENIAQLVARRDELVRSVNRLNDAVNNATEEARMLADEIVVLKEKCAELIKTRRNLTIALLAALALIGFHIFKKFI